MKNQILSCLRKAIILLLLNIISQSFLQAQNAGDPDTSFALGIFNNDVRDIKIQTDNKILVGGDFTYFKTTNVNRLARLNPDGSIDNTFNIGAGADSSIFSIAIQMDGKILVGGIFTTFNGVSKNSLVRLNTDGSIDNTFNIGSGANIGINTLAIQSDGKILAGGYFTSFNGSASNFVVRLNADGSVDNTFNIGSGADYYIVSIAIQSDGKILIGGFFVTFNGVSNNRLVRLNTDGSIDNTFNIGSGLDNQVNSIALQSDGKILVGGYFNSFNGVSKNHLVRLNTDGSLDNTLNIGSGPDGIVYLIVLQGDGKILVGGSFNSFNGVPGAWLARLNTDGSVDNTFNIGGVGGFLCSITLQTDGKILLGGYFTALNNSSKNYIGRLNADGSVDNTLNNGSGPNGSVNSITLQPNGKILLSGGFNAINNISQSYISRLNPNGTIDNSFNIGSGTIDNSDVPISISLQSDGKILAAGSFTTFNGIAQNYIVRLNSDGSIDNTFNIGSGFDYYVSSTVIQKDGKILAGGYFTSFNGSSTNFLARLNTDGSIDNTFNIGSGANDYLNSIALQPDGKILVGGNFTTYNGVSKNYLARLNADGSLDSTFNIGSGLDKETYSIAIQSDEKILVGGIFTTFNGITKTSLVRLNADGSLDNTFNIGSGTDGSGGVNTIVLQADGKILIGGFFSTFKGVSKNSIARLNTDGSLDNTFIIGTGANNTICSITMHTDGRILAGGYFNTFNNIAYNNIVRLKGDPVYYNTIQGNIFTDGNNDCNLQSSEKKLPSIIVKATPGPYYGGSDAYGYYKLRVDSGSVVYAITNRFNSLNSKRLLNQCASSQTVSLTGAAKDTCCFNFADSVKQCSELYINIQKINARQCIRNTTYVNYINYGNSSAAGAEVKIEYPSHIFPVTSIPMWTSIQGSVLTYNIGTILSADGGQIIITDSVDCAVDLSHQVECIKAIISPISNCIADNPAWDKSSIAVTGTCTSGSAHFNITNDGSGDMGSSLQYRVFVNDTLVYAGNYKLNSGQTFTIDYPAEGQTIRVEADQHPLHPGNSHPRATVENCGIAISVTASRGLVTTAPLDDLDEEVAMTCAMITNSHDPNEKQAFPSGTGIAHNIGPGEEIEYVIHFQNTGNDTAYTVTVVDTLDAGLDVASFTQGASSNPYTLNISGKGQAVLTFTFNKINLPDSTTNNLASSGLVSYRMTVPSNAAIGTVIKNKAYIFFDYNAPIVTNETMHTVDTVTQKDFSKGSAVFVGAVTTGLTGKRSDLAVKIYPNPTSGMVTLEMPESASSSEMRVYSLIGVLQKSVMLDKSTTQQVNLEDIQEGLYIYEILQNGERKAGGMLKIK